LCSANHQRQEDLIDSIKTFEDSGKLEKKTKEVSFSSQLALFQAIGRLPQTRFVKKQNNQHIM
jgi:hypothetical protein